MAARQEPGSWPRLLLWLLRFALPLSQKTWRPARAALSLDSAFKIKSSYLCEGRNPARTKSFKRFA
jgi:hypothetical protein